MKEHGISGENAASEYLTSKGYKLVARNYSSRFGEIDIIAEDGGYILFVEVKSRAAKNIAPPRAAVNPVKQAKIIKTALLFLSENPVNKQPRFDVIEVVYNSKTDFSDLRINHIENAFSAEGYYF